MATLIKTKTGEYKITQLQEEINVNSTIVPACMSILADGTSLTLEFTALLTEDEEAELDTVISNHTPEPDVVDVALLPVSDIDGKKLAVHPSYKPKIDGTTYAQWVGAGDDLAEQPEVNIGDGELLHFNMEQQSGSPLIKQVELKDVKFDPAHGRVWLHEGYLKFENGGMGDYISADVIASATSIAAFGSPLTLYVEDNWVKYSTGSPAGTHNFAGTPVLIPRPFSKDGDWDYDGVTLTPNFAGNGEYKISDIDRIVHRYINKIPCYGSCATYFSMTSDETAELPAGYFLRIHAHNESNTNWTACVIMEIYRQRTHVP